MLPDDLNRSFSKGFKPSNLPFIEKRLSVKVNERFVINEYYVLLPINVRMPCFAISNNGK